METGPVEGPWELPEGWRWEPLGRYSAEKSESINPAKWPEKVFELYSVPSFDSRRPEVIPGGEIGSSKQTVQPGDVLLCKINPRINRAWVVGAQTAHDQIASTEWIRFPASPDLVPEFLRHYFSMEVLRSYLAMNASGVGGSLMRVKAATLASYPVPVPPLDTQRRIVARIDELFSELDDGEAALARARADLETYRKSLLKAAVTGELTADWRAANPPAETGEQLLQRILADRKARWEADPKNRGKRYTEPSGNLPEDLGELPSGWCWATLEQLAWQSGYGTSAKCDYDAKGEPVLRIPNLRDGGVDLSDIKHALVRLDLNDGDYLAPGDLLIVRTNGSRELIGRAGIVEQSFGSPTHFASYLIRFRIGGSAELHRWIRLFTDSAVFRSNVLGSIGSSAGQYNLSLSKLNDFPVAVPPADEVAVVLEALKARELSLEDQLPSAQLRQSILAAAFRGEL